MKQYDSHALRGLRRRTPDVMEGPQRCAFVASTYGLFQQTIRGTIAHRPRWRAD